MTRTMLYRLQYVVVFVFLAAGVVAVAQATHWDRRVLLALVVVLLVPGRLLGVLWRDLYRGRRLLGEGRFQESLRHSRQFLALLERQPWRRGLWWLAWAFYTRDPKAMALNNVGAALIELGDWDAAEEPLRQAAELDAEYPLPHYNLAVIAELRRDEVAMREHAATAVALGFSGGTVDRITEVAAGILARVEGRGVG